MRPAWNDEEALIDYVVQAILDLSRGGDPIPPVKATDLQMPPRTLCSTSAVTTNAKPSWTSMD
jgi:hypothetical protein